MVALTTMEGDFLRDRLEQGRELRVLVPRPEDRQVVHQVIYGQLVQG